MATRTRVIRVQEPCYKGLEKVQKRLSEEHGRYMPMTDVVAYLLGRKIGRAGVLDLAVEGAREAEEEKKKQEKRGRKSGVSS